MGRIVVTGARGYLGAHVLSALRQAGHDAVGLTRRDQVGLEVCDLLDGQCLHRVMDAIAPTMIVHCAWESPKDDAAYDDVEASERGVTMLDNLLLATSAPVLLISSMTVYGLGNASRTYREEDAGELKTVYARSKWKAEQRLYSTGREGFAIRIPGLFGGGRRNGVVWNLLNSLTQGKSPQLPAQPILWAAMDVRDAAVAVTRLCDVAPRPAIPVNIGYRDVYSISRLVAMLDELTGRTTASDVEHPDFTFSLSRAQALGVAPAQSLRGACLRLLAGDA